MIVAAGAAILQIAIALGLMGPMSHSGIALANSIAITIEVLILLCLLHNRLDGIDTQAILSHFARVLLAGGIMSLTVYLVTSWTDMQNLSTVLILACGSMTGVLVYGTVSFLLGIWHPTDIKRMF